MQEYTNAAYAQNILVDVDLAQSVSLFCLFEMNLQDHFPGKNSEDILGELMRKKNLSCMQSNRFPETECADGNRESKLHTLFYFSIN